MVKFLSVMLALAMIFSFACGVVMAAEQTAKEAGNKMMDASKSVGKGIGKGTVATGKAVGQTVLNTGTAVVDIGKSVAQGTGSILTPTATLGKDASVKLANKKTEEKK